jgi:hypothetical protein
MPTAEHHAVGARRSRDQARPRPAGGRRREREVVEEAEQHDAQEARDRQLEAAVAARLQREDRERHDGGDQAGGERRARRTAG